MNIAFTTVLILIVLFPGILLRNSYLSGIFSKKYISLKFIDEIGKAIIPGVLFNLLGYFIVNHFTNYKIDLTDIGCLLTGVNDTPTIHRIFININNHLFPISMYFIVLWGTSVILGHLSRFVVRWRKWDKKYQMFRFSNEWYYFCSGEYVEIAGDDSLEDIDFMISEVLVDIGGGKHILYIGYLNDFFMTKDGGLESIYLEYPIRIDYDNMKAGEETEIGDLLMIPYRTIINISVRYLKIENDDLD